MRYNELIERAEKNTGLAKVIAASIKAKATLSSTALAALDAWNVNWTTGPLEQAFRSNSALAQEINHAFEPVKVVIRSTYGDTIELYRGQRDYEENELTPNRVLFSWTSDPQVAKDFLNRHQIRKVFTDAEIKNAIETFKRTGYCKLGSYAYKVAMDDPDMYWMYRGHENITGGDVNELEADLRDQQRDQIEYNDEMAETGTLYHTRVSVDDIVWVINDLGSKEFIVKLNPLSLK